VYLSRLISNQRHREARRDLANPYEMHRTLDRAVSNALSRNEERLLWRLDVGRNGNPRSILVQTLTRPDWKFLPEGYLTVPAEFKQLRLEIARGSRFRFRLRANPTVKRDGKRHALRLLEERLEWLTKKAQAGGFSVLSVHLEGEERVRAVKDATPITLEATTFGGTFVVDDPSTFRATLEQGVGPAKGLGMGLLSIASLALARE
jgi:CRISPR system Cascade subunit CasE